MDYSREKLKWNGWGWKDKLYTFPSGEQAFCEHMKNSLGLKELPISPSKSLEELDITPCEIQGLWLDELRNIFGNSRVKTDAFERVFHARGKSFVDLLRLRKGQLERLPDVIVYPEKVSEIERLLDFAEKHSLGVIPFGGGSSVVGGVEACGDEGIAGTITLDTTLMNKMLELDEISQTATFQTGVYGPQLEELLKARGFTLGHFPQSFEFSTLGGWLAARGAGHLSDKYGKAEHFLVSAKIISPRGAWATRPLPASAAGPDLNQFIAGSEGAIGIITEATVRIYRIPEAKRYEGVLFKEFIRGMKAIRRIVQASIPMAMLRLSDEDETQNYARLRETRGNSIKQKLVSGFLKLRGFGQRFSILILGAEGDSDTVNFAMRRALKICRDEGGLPVGQKVGSHWHSQRYETPYLRDYMLSRGIAVDTLETSAEWSKISGLHSKIKETISANLLKEGLRGLVMNHISHSYRDGASIYCTFVYPMRADREIEQWWNIKKEVSDVIHSEGGTISHHHGVGKDHLPWMENEKGVLGMDLLKGVKARLDPGGIMNPGKLINP